MHKVPERAARLGRQLGVVRRTPGRIKADPAGLAVDVDELSHEAGALDSDRPAGQRRCDPRELLFLVDSILVLGKADRGDRSDQRECERLPDHAEGIGVLLQAR